jgi:hypothetical protein
MPYLVDGHNLIGQIPGLSLDDPDDELALVARLRSFCARTGKQVIVYFDGAPAGSAGPASTRGLTVRFVRRPRTADEAILAQLRRLGREAPNWTVVSSDRALQRAARSMGARSIGSEAYSRQLLAGGPSPPAPEKPQGLTPEEVAEWQQLFGKRKAGPRTGR